MQCEFGRRGGILVQRFFKNTGLVPYFWINFRGKPGCADYFILIIDLIGLYGNNLFTAIGYRIIFSYTFANKYLFCSKYIILF